MIQFYDETGINPLPAGIEVSVYPGTGPQTPATLVGTAFTIAGGTAAISVNQAVPYVATFFGTQAPTEAQAFSGGATEPTNVTVQAYRSPSMSVEGYTQAQIQFWPNGWFSESAQAPGGIAWAVAQGLSAGLAFLDTQGQTELERMRLQSCVGPEIDSWAVDFLGSFLPRYDQESDADYRGRVIAALATPKCTIAAITAVVKAFYSAIAATLAQQMVQNLSFNQDGGFNTGGGFNVGFDAPSPAAVIPDVYVWDRQTRPDLADEFNVNPNNNDGTFVIQIGYKNPFMLAWFLDNAYLDNTTYLLAEVNDVQPSPTPPDPRLGPLVQLTKSEGTRPLYQAYEEV
jgi:hypothetical protein